MNSRDRELPIISIITPTLNNEKELKPFFQSIRKQKYPMDKVEIIIADGGSRDKTVELAKKLGAKVIKNTYVLAEPGVYLGMKQAKGDLSMILATDNFFEDPHAFKTIASVFDNKDIYVALPKHDSKKNYSIFSRYHNTFTDPFNHFVYGDAANGRTFKRKYKTLIHNDVFDVYDFKNNSVKPMMSLSQGLTLRTKYKRSKSSAYDDLAPIIDIIEQGRLIAFVHSVSIYHDTISNLKHFLKKIRWATQNAIERKNYGIAFRTHRLSNGQRIRMTIWPLYAFSFVAPFVVSLYGLARDRRTIWLFHAPNCWIAAYASATQVIQSKLLHKNSISRQ